MSQITNEAVDGLGWRSATTRLRRDGDATGLMAGRNEETLLPLDKVGSSTGLRRAAALA
jgi:hypothetical protein